MCQPSSAREPPGGALRLRLNTQQKRGNRRDREVCRLAATMPRHGRWCRHLRRRVYMGWRRLFCENVDDAVDCIGSPNAAAGSTDHFNARNLLEGNVENFVKDAAEGRHVHRSAVDGHQHFVAEATVEPPDTDGPTAGIN